MTQLTLNDGAHGLAFCRRAAFPVDGEVLMADGADDIFLLLGGSEEDLHFVDNSLCERWLASSNIGGFSGHSNTTYEPRKLMFF